MESNMVNKLSSLLRLGLVSKNNVRRATMLLQQPDKAMSNPAYRTLMQDILVDIMDRILNSKALYAAVRQNLVREPVTEDVGEERTKTLLRSGLVPKKDIMVARRALSSKSKAKSMATVKAYRELMIDLLDSMVGKITGNPTLYNAFKQTMGKQKVEDMEESFEQPNEDTIAELLLHETAAELLEANKPTKPDLWSQAKSKARAKFKVYPSAYANGWAVKWYNEHGGGWKSVSEGKTFFRLQEELGYGTSGKTSDAREKSRHRARKLRDKLEGTKDKKAVKESALNESEYSEVLTGYPNRGVDTDVEPVKYDADRLAKINGVLTALGRYTYQHTSEAMTRIRTRLNLFMLDFQWTPWKWQEGNTGVFTLDVVKFGRVDGVDAYTGEVRMDGRANPMSGFSEYTLTVNVSVSDNGFYSVQSNLQPKLSLVPEGTEADGDTIEEDLQTPARQRDMEHAIQRAENKASRGYEAKMTKTGKAAARGRKQEAKYDAVSRRLIARDTKEYDSSKLYGRGGKVVKGKRKPVKEDADHIEEMAQTPERSRQVTRELEKLRSEFENRFEKLYKKGAMERYSKKLYGKDGKVVKGKRKPVKEEVVDEMAQTPERVKEMQGKLDTVASKIRNKVGDQPAAKKKYNSILSKDRNEFFAKKMYGKGGKVVKEGAEQIEEMLKAGDTVKVPHKGKMVRGRIVRHDSGGSGKAQQHGGGYVVDVGEYGSITVPGHKVVKEALIGGQKKLDVNKNKRLDSQDFKLLRAKKKPMQEQEQKKPWWMTSTAAELAAAAQSASDARKGEEAEKRKRHAQQNRRMKWTLADKAQGKKTVKEAAMGKPKKMKMLRKIKDGKVVSQRVIPVPDPTPKKS